MGPRSTTGRLTWRGSGGVYTSGPFGERAVVSPSGERVAYVLPRARPVDLVERERVRVETVAGGDELAEVPGPATVRTLHWVTDHRLLIARDAKGGMCLSLVEVPPGEVIAEGFLPGRTEQRFRVTQTLDGRALCAEETGGGAWSSRCVWRVDGETLAVRGRVEHPDFQRGVSLHPDGERIMFASFNGSASRIEGMDVWMAWVEPRVASPWHFAFPEDARPAFTLRWCGPDAGLLVVESRDGEDGDDPESLSPIEKLEWARFDCARGVEQDVGEIAGAPFDAVAVTPDGARLAALKLARLDEESERGLSVELTLHALGDDAPPTRYDAVLPDHVRAGWSRAAVAWRDGGERALVVVPGTHGNTVLATKRDGAMVVVPFSCDTREGWRAGLSVHGRWLVEHLEDEHGLRIMDIAGLT